MVPTESEKDVGNALVGEFMMTFLLIFTVLQTAVNSDFDYSSMACFVIGLAVFLGHSLLIPIDGCSINPTRSFGPDVVEYISPAPAVFYAVPAQVVEYLAPPPVAYTAPATTATVGFGSLPVTLVASTNAAIEKFAAKLRVLREVKHRADLQFWVDE